MDSSRRQAPAAPTFRCCASCGAKHGEDGQASSEQSLAAAEHRLRVIFDSMFGFLGIFTLDGMLIDANRAALETVGLSLDDMRGQPFWEIYCWSYSREAQDRLRIAISRAAAGDVVRYETCARVKGEQMIMVDVIICPLRDVAGNVENILGFAVDITERKQAEQALRESEERYALVEHAINDGIWDWNLLTNEVFYSPRWAELLGYPGPELFIEQSPTLDMVHPDDKTAFMNTIRQSLQNKERYSLEIRLRHQDGGYRWMLSRGEPICDDTGRPVRMLGSITDISGRKRAESQISALHDQLAHVSRLGVLGELAAGLAHELNQPLTALRLYATAAEHLGAASDSPELCDCLKQIDEQAHRAAEIIRRMRSFVSHNLNRRESVSPNDLVREVTSLLENELRHERVKLELALGDDLPRIIVDPIQIQQVLVNLIRNAIDAMDCLEDDQRSLTVRTSSENSNVRFEVADTGCGIDVSMIEEMFKPFRSFKPKGLGLGLAICRTLIEAHRGVIGAALNPTKGAVFHFALPAVGDQEAT